MRGAQFEIRIAGTPRSYRDRKDFAMGGRTVSQEQKSAQARVNDGPQAPASAPGGAVVEHHR